MTALRVRWTLLLAVLLAAANLLVAQEAPATRIQNLALTEPIPVDPAVTMGALENGLRYYVRANNKEEHRAQLRLVVKVGSVVEDDDQLGLAHFAEHMAFNGTARFPKKEIETFIQSLGMRFGADLNASTGFDETIYMLRVPTNDPGTMDRALMILADWAQNISFEDEEIELERGVVLEEWRLRRGAGARTNEAIVPIWYAGSHYADRIPIGKPEILQTFEPDRLRQFYRDWYRPDLMAVVAVGDFDKAAVEGLIRKHFAPIPAPEDPRPRPYSQIPDHPGTVYAIATDKEATYTWIEIDNLLPGRESRTVGAYREQIADRLFSAMLNARFSELARRPDPPFIGASVSRAIWGGRACADCWPREDAWLYAQVRDDGIERGFQALLTEVERVSRFGFTPTEMEREKQRLLRNYERAAAEDVNRMHASRVNDYIRHFVNDGPLPTAADEYALHQRFLPDITLDEVSRRASQWFSEENRFVTVVTPEKSGVVPPDEATLEAAIRNAVPGELRPYVDSVAHATLVDTPPAPGAIVKVSTNEAAGITEWELSNGVRVVLKPTTFREDEIVFRAESFGGTSLASDADYIPASTAVRVVTAGGLGALDAVDLQKLLAGRIATVNPFIGELDEGLTGSSSRRDLETMFQLIHLRFTAPRADPAAVQVQAEHTRADMGNLDVNPDFVFSQRLAAVRSQDHLRRRVATAADVDEWNLETSLAFYRDRFADASDFRFVFVGSFDLETMRPLVERYLGSLPSTGRNETWRDVGVRTPAGVVEETVRKGIEPRGRTTIVFSGPFDYREDRRVALQAMTEILSRRLLDTIREELGSAYSISAGQSVPRLPRPEYAITIQFGHDPERTGSLIERIFEEIDRLKADGPTETQVRDVREALLRTFEGNIRQNAFLLNEINRKVRFGEDPAETWELPVHYRALTPAMIQQAARTYLDTGRYVRVTLLPEDPQDADCARPLRDPILRLDVAGGYPTPTRDGCWVFTAFVDREGAEDPGSGIAVLRRKGDTFEEIRTVPMAFPRGGGGVLFGMAMTRDDRILVVSSNQLTFFDVDRLKSGDGDPVLGRVGAPRVAGSFGVTISPDDRYVFASQVTTALVAIVDLQKARASGFDASALIGVIPTAPQALAPAVTPDGEYVFTTTARPPDVIEVPRTCTNDTDTEGAVQVAHVQRATADASAATVAFAAPAGCRPTALAVSPDGSRLSVTSGGVLFSPTSPADSAVVVFDIRPLKDGKAPTLIGRIPVSPGPIGIADAGDRLFVGFLPRQTTPSPSPDAVNAPHVMVLDPFKAGLGEAAVIGTIPVTSMNLMLSADRRTLFGTDAGWRRLMVIDLQRATPEPVSP